MTENIGNYILGLLYIPLLVWKGLLTLLVWVVHGAQLVFFVMTVSIVESGIVPSVFYQQQTSGISYSLCFHFQRHF
jgi:hypothetical protein